MRRTAIIRSKSPPVARADRPGRSASHGESAAAVQARRPVTIESAGLALQRAAGNAAAAQLMARRGRGLTDVTVKEPRRKGKILDPGETLMPGESLQHQGQQWTVDTVNRLTRPASSTISRAEQVPEPDA